MAQLSSADRSATISRNLGSGTRFFTHTFGNGLALVAEAMPAMQSAAMTLLLPAGSATDPQGACGSATVLCDMVLRGAGPRDNRALTEHLDSLGLQRSSSVGVYHTRFSAAAVAAQLVEGLAAYGDIVRRPHLPESGFEPSRDLALQALEGLDDDPRQKLLIRLREWHLPSPLGRSSMGNAPDLERLTVEALRADHARRYHASGAILAVAGNVDFAALTDRVQAALGDLPASAPATIELSPPPGAYHFEPQQSEQTHIGLAYPSIPETHPDYYVVRLAVEVLSGGMSGRLFTEIREKRGLVYSVWAGYSALKDRGSILAYAGTSNERAQATIDTLVAELHRLSEGVTAAELARAKTGLKASTVMQGESTGARAGAIAHDYYIRGRLRTLDEISSAIDAVTLDQINAYLKNNPPRGFTTVIVGPKELKLPH